MSCSIYINNNSSPEIPVRLSAFFFQVVPRSQVEKIESNMPFCSLFRHKWVCVCVFVCVWECNSVIYIFICMASSWELATWFVEVFHHVILCVFLFWRASFVWTCTSTFFSFYLFIIIIFSLIPFRFFLLFSCLPNQYEIKCSDVSFGSRLVIISDIFQTIGFLTFRIYHRQYV